MTPEQHAQHIRELEFKLHKAEYGMGMPRDPEQIKELQRLLTEALNAYASDALVIVALTLFLASVFTLCMVLT